MYRVKYLPKSNEVPRYYSESCKVDVVLDDEKVESSLYLCGLFTWRFTTDACMRTWWTWLKERLKEKKNEKRLWQARHLRRVKQSVPKGSTFGLYDANVFYWSRPDRLVNQQQPFVFWIMNELCHRTHRFAIVCRSQIVPVALFKMLKTRPASDKRRIHIGWRIYASGSRHKSSEGNEKRRAVSHRVAAEISVWELKWLRALPASALPV